MLFSILGHSLLLASFFWGFGSRTPPLGIIYSVTLEAGQSLGGLSQVPSEKNSQQAPPKKVQTTTQKTASKSITKVKEKENKTKVTQQEKSELKIKDKKQTKVEPNKAKPQETAADINKQLENALQRYRGESSDAGGKGFGAAALGGKGMGGGVVLPAEALAYRDLLRNVIKEGWRWYDTRAALVAWVTFDISKDGTISSVVLSTSSGNREFDESVLRAVWKASPLPSPPEKVYSFFKQVRFAFDPRE